VAEAVRAELTVLSPATRQRVMERMALRIAAAPPAQRRAVLRAAAPIATTRAALLRWLVIRHLMRGSRLVPGRAPLAALADEALRASAFLAPLLADGNPTAWRARLLAAMPVQPAAWPATSPRATARAFVRLQRRLAPMQRPLLWRAWLETTPRPLDDERHEALALAAVLLDLPRP
jgi:hypothetical protein